jgi:Iap family predicted aminopeptidase
MDIGARVMAHLTRLGAEIGVRPIGSPQNAAAAEYVEEVMRGAGLRVESQPFECPDWRHESTQLSLNGESIPAAANSFSPSCDLRAPLVAAGTMPELEAADIAGRAVLLYGELTRTQLGAAGAIYVSERDSRILEIWRDRKPAALITVTPLVGVRDALTEDWRLSVPSATVSAEHGLRLLRHGGAEIHLRIEASSTPSGSRNVVGLSEGIGPERIVLCAHYDTKFGTPGAMDNASGTAVLLALAETLPSEGLDTGLEFVAFSGEEHGGLGDMEYLRLREETFPSILAAINMDGIGQALGTNTITMLSSPEHLREHVAGVARNYPNVSWVDPWFASDHYTFYSRGVPSVALTSAGVNDLLHRPWDTPEWIAEGKLAEVAALVADLVRSLRDRPLDWCRSG